MKKLKRDFKNRIKLTFAIISSFFKTANSQKTVVPILCYHSINNSNNYEADSLPPSYFEQHLQYLNKNFTPISLKKALDYIDGRCPEINDPVVVTFDDGYKDNYDIAFPLLKKYSIPATFFIVTGFINGNLKLINDINFNAMTWAQIKEMNDDGLFDFGAHTDSHPILSNINSEDVVKELISSKKIMEKELDQAIDLFAYPNGQQEDVPDVALKTVKNIFSCSCSTIWTTVHEPKDRFMLGRVMISGTDTLSYFKHKVLGNFDFIRYIQKTKFSNDNDISKYQ